MTCMTTVMCVTEELQVTAQLVGVMPRGHLGVLPTAPLVWLRILLDLMARYDRYGGCASEAFCAADDGYE
jgi:hypothetical protein